MSETFRIRLVLGEGKHRTYDRLTKKEAEELATEFATLTGATAEWDEDEKMFVVDTVPRPAEA